MQYYNYIMYINQMQQATGMPFNEPFEPYNPQTGSNFSSKVKDAPPGRPSRSDMTYGEYKQRTDPGYNKPIRSDDPRGNRNQRMKVDDGWGNNETSAKRTASNDDDWDVGPSESKKIKTDGGNEDWGEFVPADNSSFAKSTTKSNDDDWGDDEKTTSFSRDRSSSSSSSFSGGGFRGSRGGRGSREGSFQRSDRGDRSDSRPPRQEWKCSKCRCGNFSFRQECYRCNEPRGDAPLEPSTRDNNNSSRGEFRGGSRGSRGSRVGFRGGRGGGGFNRDSKPVASGWSDDEGEKEKDKDVQAPVMPTGGDDWDEPVVKKQPEVAVKKRPADDDDWGESSTTKKSEESWDDDKPTVKTEKKTEADDEWAELEAPTMKKDDKESWEDLKPTAVKTSSETKVTSSNNDDWDSAEDKPKAAPKAAASNDDDDWN
jgi:hypothetical protein